MLNKSGIYKITNVLNGKCYIGSAVNIKKRWYLHKSDLRLNKHHSPHLQNSWNKYGKENFKFEVLFYCDKEELIKCEQIYFDELLPEYNVCKIAGNCLGMTHTEESKGKIGAAQKGRIHTKEHVAKIAAANKGKTRTFSEEAKAKMSAKMSAAAKGKIFSKETRIKLSEARKGKYYLKDYKHSEETKEKIRVARKGRKHSKETILKIVATRNRTLSIKHIINNWGCAL